MHALKFACYPVPLLSLVRRVAARPCGLTEVSAEVLNAKAISVPPTITHSRRWSADTPATATSSHEARGEGELGVAGLVD